MAAPDGLHRRGAVRLGMVTSRDRQLPRNRPLKDPDSGQSLIASQIISFGRDLLNSADTCSAGKASRHTSAGRVGIRSRERRRTSRNRDHRQRRRPPGVGHP
jgi:hypothetical protein